MRFVLVLAFSFYTLQANDNLHLDAAILKPFVENYCIKCHGKEKQKGDVRLDQIFMNGTHKVDLSLEDRVFELSDILDQLQLGEMPPKKELNQPSQWTINIVLLHDICQGFLPVYIRSHQNVSITNQFLAIKYGKDSNPSKTFIYTY